MQVLKEEINDRIKDAALKEFLDNGFEKASMRDIARKAGMSVSNLYNYFSNKEQLFYSISMPIYYQCENMFRKFSDHENEGDFKDDAFLKQFGEFTALRIGQLIKNNRDGFLLIMDRSIGTKCEGLKGRMISMLEKHFLEHLKSAQRKKDDNQKIMFIMHIIATNLVESLLEIARHYKNDELVDYTIGALMKYHLRGISQFF